ncbi:MAG: hypothetical protein IJX76_00025 [Clostridia bacterium]|nr:hypothetical protein [Clostridia bacterium]
MKIKRSITLLLAAAMLAAPLTACQSGQTTQVTAASDDETVTKPASFTPDEIWEKMQTSSYRITSETKTEAEGVQVKMKYVIERQANRFRMQYDLDMGSMGKMSEELYFNTANGRAYAAVEGDWYYYVDKTVASEEMILSEVFLMIAPDLLFANDSYEYDAKEARYAMKQDVLSEQTGYEGEDAGKVSLYLSEADGAYSIAISDGTDGSEMRIDIAFADVTVKIPSATELPDVGGEGGGGEDEAELPYTGASLTALLLRTQQLKVDLDSVRATDFSPWSGEEVDHLFDGTTAKCAGQRNSSEMCIFFSLEEAATLSAYVMVTGNDTAQFPFRNPVEWYLLGTNRAKAMTSSSLNMSDWAVLDYVYDGSLETGNFVRNGYAIDPAAQGEYRYYALVLCYSPDTQFQLSELELYGAH